MSGDSILTRTQRFDKRIRAAVFLIQALQIAFYLAYMLNVTDFGPPLDDSWIHYQYSRNIAEFGEISFNQGQWSTGTTSLLWNLILALGIKLGLPVVEFSIALGILLYFILAQQAFSVFRTLWREDWKPVFAILIVVFTGNMAWFSLSGMETLLFLTLGMWWISAFRGNRFMLAGVIAGLLALTRIEGLLFILMGIFFVFRNLGWKEGWKPALRQIVFCLPIIAPSIALNLSVVGEVYPNTMAGKKWLYNLPPGLINTNPTKAFHYLLAWTATLFQTNWWPEVFDRPFTLQYLFIRLVTGGRKASVLPDFELAPHPLWLQALVVITSVILLVILLRGAFRIVRSALKDLFNGSELNEWRYLTYWFIGFNLLYFILMPLRGHGGRYQAVNFILAGMFIAEGVGFNHAVRNFKASLKRYAVIPGILLLYLASAVTWADIYASSVRHVNDVHRAAGEWLRDNLPKGSRIAVFDVGAVKYFSGLPVIDIAGLTDSEALEYLLEGKAVDLMWDKGAEYLVMIEEYSREADKNGEMEYFHCPASEKMGITQALGREMELEPLTWFVISREAYFRHWTALKTHSPIIGIYKIRWLNNSFDGIDSTSPKETIMDGLLSRPPTTKNENIARVLTLPLFSG